MESLKKEWSNLGASAGCRVWPVACSCHGATDHLQCVCCEPVAFVFAVSLWHSAWPLITLRHVGFVGAGHVPMWASWPRILVGLHPMRQTIIKHYLSSNRTKCVNDFQASSVADKLKPEEFPHEVPYQTRIVIAGTK